MQSFRDRVADYFKARPGVWIDGRAFESVGGRYAWRSRIADCRTELGMDIENRQRRVTQDGRTFKISEYRFLPAFELRA